MRVRLFRLSGFVVGLILLFAGPGGVARADIQNPGRSSFPGDRGLERREKPPNAVPQTASVVEGGSVKILLHARGHVGEMIDFLIRVPPAHGTLEGAPRQITLNTAEVIYTQTPGDNAAADSFSFAVQTRDGPVSAEATVTVRIQEPAPVLVVSPAELDFGAVKAGETTRAELTLTNQGGGEAAGHLDPPPPWTVEGASTYRLPRGASQTFALVFRPSGEQAYVDALHFRYETGGVRLVGTGLAGPGQKPPLPGNGSGALAIRPLVPQAGPSDLPPAVAEGNAAAGRPAARPAAPASPANRSDATSLEPVIPGAGTSAPAGPLAFADDVDPNGVSSFTVRDRGRTTLDLTWRAPNPPPKTYRVELRYLSLGEDDRLLVDWRPYALVELQPSHGFVDAHLSGLPPDSQQTIRIVAVDAAGQLATPSPLVVTYTLPSSTWWRPHPTKVLFVLLAICLGMIVHRRWETTQILRGIDESRRQASLTTR